MEGRARSLGFTRFGPRQVGPLLVGLTLLGCVVDVPLDDRPCPCGPGWSCDPRSERCVPESEGVCGVTGAPRSSITLAEVQVRWRADTGLEVGWTLPDEDQPRVDHYELLVGTDRDELLARGPGVQVYGRDDPEHPELQRAGLPNTNGRDPVDSVALRDLEPDTRYFIQLLVFDRDGGVQCGRPLDALTYVPLDREVVVYDESPPGFTLPGCVQHAEDAELASAGRHFARYQAQCEGAFAVCEAPSDPGSRCYENLRLRGLDVADFAISEGPFEEAAVLSIDVALDDSGDAYWSELFLHTEPPELADDPLALPGVAYLWVAAPQTLTGDGRYRTYSTPLAQMRLRCFDDQLELDAARPEEQRQCGGRLRLSPEALARGVRGVRVGASLAHLGAIRVDRARLRY